MKKRSLSMFSILMMGILCFGFASCGDDDDDKEVGNEAGNEQQNTSVEQSANAINGHEYVDLGLPSGTLWATMNLGAESPNDIARFFAWGEPQEYDLGNVLPFGTYSYKYYDYEYKADGSVKARSILKYCTNSSYGNADNKMELDASDDAATAEWGARWQIPSKAQLDELRSECSWTWTSQDNTNGYLVKSKSNGNSIFMPCGGGYSTGGGFVHTENGYYWSRSLFLSDNLYGYCLELYPDYVSYDLASRDNGLNVRPVVK